MNEAAQRGEDGVWRGSGLSVAVAVAEMSGSWGVGLVLDVQERWP